MAFSLFTTTQRDVRPPDDFGTFNAASWADPQSQLAEYVERIRHEMRHQDQWQVVSEATQAAQDVAPAEEVVVRERTEQPRPVPIQPTVPADYDAVALELGFEPHLLNDARLRDRLTELDIPIYDYAQVDGYLRHLKTKAKADIWCWRPLRPKDVLKTGWGAKQTHKGGAIGVETKWLDGSYAPGRTHSAPYDRLVPKRALQRAVLIMRKLGDEVAFFVSDFARPKAEISDPFIMVVMRRDPSIRVVFDVWNEPGFDVAPIEGT